ncbi:zinc finger protein 530-like isoform X3 [Bufo gargarizans]|uniref:zinc finger protein 530-like isoform X3 n=1 Tax=Bufo gargarizans TaxID=30331 RepID=UPI001CF588C2|nr:zinc finger protein 530-like isoform X3 [Bufo gargarizans]
MSLCSIPAPDITMPSGQVPVNFNDVAIYFSNEEWRYLEEWQKNLYTEVMQENLEILLSLDDVCNKIEENTSTFSSNKEMWRRLKQRHKKENATKKSSKNVWRKTAAFPAAKWMRFY